MASTTSASARDAIAALTQLMATMYGVGSAALMSEQWSTAAMSLHSWWTARMSSAARRAVKKLPTDATFEPEFLEIADRHGLEAALIHLAGQHDLSREETVAVQATIEGLIQPMH